MIRCSWRVCRGQALGAGTWGSQCLLLGGLVPWEDAARQVEQERGLLWEGEVFAT